jgi:kumamolisin
MATKKLVPISGSKKEPLPGARIIAPAAADERLEVTVRLRPRSKLPDAEEMLKAGARVQQLAHDEYEDRYGANPSDLQRIRKFADEHDLSVVQESPARRAVVLSGTVANLSEAFGVDLHIYEHPGGTYRGRVGAVKVPEDLASVVEGVFGLDNRPVAHPHFRMHRDFLPHTAGAHPFNPNEVAKLYNFPAGTDGSGQCIGIIELGGGYRPQDLQAYFQNLGIAVPSVIPVSVDGAHNSPSGNPGGDDGEVVLDIEVAGAVAPGAKIVVYFAPNDRTAKGFLDAVSTAVHDQVNNPTVISISWGGPEQIPNDSFQTQFNQTLQAAALLGITVCVAAGDNGAADVGPLGWDGEPHCDFPSSSPFALSCGGTRLISAQGAIKAESVWNQHFADTSPAAGPNGSFGSGGGGVSGAFPLPNYQSNAGVPPNPAGSTGRGVPDVTGAGDPDTGYNVLVDGQSFPIGGTSAVAPLWAALAARINQKLGARVGFINPQIYALSASGAFHDVTVGDNRVSYQGSSNVGYDAGPGWDACSGLGSPDGTKLASVLTPPTAPGDQASSRNGKQPTAKVSMPTKIKKKSPKKRKRQARSRAARSLT